MLRFNHILLIIFFCFIWALPYVTHAQLKKSFLSGTRSPQLRAIQDVALSADGKLLITAQQDGSVSLWNRMSMELIKKYERDNTNATNIYDLYGSSKVEIEFLNELNLLIILRDGVLEFRDVTNHRKIDAIDKLDSEISTMHLGGSLLAVADSRNRIRIWDLMAPGISYSFKNSHKIKQLEFLDKGRIASLDKEGIGVWSLATWKKELRIPFGNCYGFGFDTGTKRLIVLSLGRENFRTKVKLSLIDSKKGLLIRELEVPNSIPEVENSYLQFTGRYHPQGREKVGFSPDGKFVTVTGLGKFLVLWNAKTGQLLTALRSEKEALVTSFAFNATGRYLATGDWHGMVNIWELTNNSLMQNYATNRRKKDFLGARYNRDNLERWSKEITLKLGEKWNKTKVADFSPPWIYFSNNGLQKQRKLNLDDFKDFFLIKGHVKEQNRIAQLSVNDRPLEIKSNKFKFRALLNEGENRFDFNAIDEFGNQSLYPVFIRNGSDKKLSVEIVADSASRRLQQLNKLIFSATTRQLYVGHSTKQIEGINMHSGLIDKLFLPKQSNIVTNMGYKPSFNPKAISRDGRYLIVSGNFGAAVYDLKSGRRPKKLKEIENGRSIKIGKDKRGYFYIYGGNYSFVKKGLFNEETQLFPGFHDPLADNMTNLEITNDGNFVFSGSSEGRIRLWNLKTGELHQTLSQPFEEEVYSNLTGYDSMIVTLESGVKAFGQHESGILDMVISDDDKLLASSHNSFLLKVWKTTVAGSSYALKVPKSLVISMTFSPDNQFLAAGGTDGDIYLWKLSTKELLWRRKHFMGGVSNVQIVDGQVYAISEGSMKSLDLLSGFENIGVSTFLEGEYIVHASDGYYMGANGVRRTNFKMGNATFNTQQVDIYYNRPDIIATRLGGLSEERNSALKGIVNDRWKFYGLPDQKRRELLSGSSNFGLLQKTPQFSVIEDNIAPYGQWAVAIKLGQSESAIKRVFISVNGYPIFGAKGFEIKEQDLGVALNQFKIPLQIGRNTVDFWVMDANGVQSLKKRIVKSFNAKRNRSELYFLGVGLSDYKELLGDSITSLYGIKDLSYQDQEVAALGQQMEQYYHKVHKSILTSKEATKSNIIKEAKRLFASAKINDVVMVYLGGWR